MSDENILRERGRLVLDDARRVNKPTTLFHLEGLARGLFTDLDPVAIRAVVNEALRQDNVENRGSGDADRGTPKVPAKPGEELSPVQLREITRLKLTADPKLKPGVLWAEINKLGVPRPSRSSWEVSYFYPVRAQILAGESPDAQMTPKTSAKAPVPLTRPAPAPARMPQNGGPKPTVASGSARPTVPAPVLAPAVELEDAPLVARAASSVPVIASKPVVAVESGAGARPASIELGNGEEILRATRREDGSWDLEFKARVDPETMDTFTRDFTRRIFAQPASAPALVP